MADITTDPLTAVYNELWLILADSTDFVAESKPGNRIHYIGKRKPADPEKEEVSTEDLPEVRIIPGGIIPHLQNTSNSSRMTVRYEIQARSGSKDLGVGYYPLIWAIYKAMRPWATRLAALTISENASGRFVVSSIPEHDIAEVLERGEVTRGIEGWSAVWLISVDMWFASSALS